MMIRNSFLLIMLIGLNALSIDEDLKPLNYLGYTNKPLFSYNRSIPGDTVTSYWFQNSDSGNLLWMSWNQQLEVNEYPFMYGTKAITDAFNPSQTLKWVNITNAPNARTMSNPASGVQVNTLVGVNLLGLHSLAKMYDNRTYLNKIAVLLIDNGDVQWNNPNNLEKSSMSGVDYISNKSASNISYCLENNPWAFGAPFIEGINYNGLPENEVNIPENPTEPFAVTKDKHAARTLQTLAGFISTASTPTCTDQAEFGAFISPSTIGAIYSNYSDGFYRPRIPIFADIDYKKGVPLTNVLRGKTKFAYDDMPFELVIGLRANNKLRASAASAPTGWNYQTNFTDQEDNVYRYDNNTLYPASRNKVIVTASLSRRVSRQKFQEKLMEATNFYNYNPNSRIPLVGFNKTANSYACGGRAFHSMLQQIPNNFLIFVAANNLDDRDEQSPDHVYDPKLNVASIFCPKTIGVVGYMPAFVNNKEMLLSAGATPVYLQNMQTNTASSGRLLSIIASGGNASIEQVRVLSGGPVMMKYLLKNGLTYPNHSYPDSTDNLNLNSLSMGNGNSYTTPLTAGLIAEILARIPANSKFLDQQIDSTDDIFNWLKKYRKHNAIVATGELLSTFRSNVFKLNHSTDPTPRASLGIILNNQMHDKIFVPNYGCLMAEAIASQLNLASANAIRQDMINQRLHIESGSKGSTVATNRANDQATAFLGGDCNE